MTYFAKTKGAVVCMKDTALCKLVAVSQLQDFIRSVYKWASQEDSTYKVMITVNLVTQMHSLTIIMRNFLLD